MKEWTFKYGSKKSEEYWEKFTEEIQMHIIIEDWSMGLPFE